MFGLLVGLNKGVANDRTDIMPAYPNFGYYCDVVFLSRCFMNFKAMNMKKGFISLWIIGSVYWVLDPFDGYVFGTKIHGHLI